MPVFRPRTRIEILREMIARVVGRSRLSGLRRNGLVFHVLSSAANEDSEQYFQLARLRDLFSLDNATGSDLDERAAEMNYDGTTNERAGAQKATSSAVFARVTTVGTIPIGQGTVIAAVDSQGQIQFKTTAPGQILNGNTQSASVPIIALEAGTRYNVDAGAIVKMVSRVPGVLTVTNPAKISNGVTKETDVPYRARLRQWVQSLSRGTPFAVESFAANTQLPDASRIRFAKTVEPVIPTGMTVVYVDDGTGGLDQYNSDFLTTPETLIASAAGGEDRTQTSQYAIRDDGSFVLKKNGVTLTRNADYFLRRDTGQIGFTVALSAADNITAYYRFYTGLVAEAQKVVSGVPTDRSNYPGVAPSATETRVLPAIRALQTLAGQLSVKPNFDVLTVTTAVINAIQTYINALSIGEAVLVLDIYRALTDLKVQGIEDFRITNLSGSTPPENQITAANAVPRILSAGISIV